MNSLLGKSNFNYKKENGHRSWNRHCIFVSENFATKYVEFIIENFNKEGDNSLIEDNSNLDKWKASLELNSNPDGMFNNYFFKNEYQFQIMAPIFTLCIFLKAIKFKNYDNLIKAIGYLNEVRIIVLKDQKEDLILSEKLHKAMYGTKGEHTTVYPAMAFNEVMKILAKNYKPEERKHIFKFSVCKQKEKLFLENIDFIFQIGREKADYFKMLDKKTDLRIFKNCYIYDINAVYLILLAKLFPKCTCFKTWYKKRHDKDNYYLNLVKNFVESLHINQYDELSGKISVERETLLLMGIDATYNWFQLEARKMILDHIAETGSNLLYADADIFIVQNSKNLLEKEYNSEEVGLDASGDVAAINVVGADEIISYKALQFRNNLNNQKFVKGTLPISLINDLELFENISYPIYKKTIYNTYDTVEIKKF